MRARIFALAGIIAMAACSNDPTSPTTSSTSVTTTTSTESIVSGQMADNSWASATTGGTSDQWLDPSMYD